ncbi:MAG TPA: septal ring lytic transglycosylase RlpA family protein [Burkholderiales bacterium]|nr:septal ring lytic transglycosylase RlpA family protein [Burkholderiales bacterium]
MYAPAQQAQPPAALAPVEIAAAATPSLGQPALGRPLASTLRIRRASLNVLADRQTSIAGTLSPHVAGRTVALQALGGRGWHDIARTRTGAGGRFRLRYTPRRTGSERVRVRFAGDGAALPAHRRLGELNVYRLAEASWYGGGGSLACGGALTSSTLGVANKTLPCGTLVTLRYGGRSIRVPVVDRGPYVAGREFDLTEATKYALGFGDTGPVWSTR